MFKLGDFFENNGKVTKILSKDIISVQREDIVVCPPLLACVGGKNAFNPCAYFFVNLHKFSSKLNESTRENFEVKQHSSTHGHYT